MRNWFIRFWSQLVCQAAEPERVANSGSLLDITISRKSSVQSKFSLTLCDKKFRLELFFCTKPGSVSCLDNGNVSAVHHVGKFFCIICTQDCQRKTSTAFWPDKCYAEIEHTSFQQTCWQDSMSTGAIPRTCVTRVIGKRKRRQE